MTVARSLNDRVQARTECPGARVSGETAPSPAKGSEEH